jgi:hypothetical protein
MPDSFRRQARSALEFAMVFAPSLISMYVLYWLEYGEIWTTETAHRGKISVAILAIGMALSFFVYSRFARRERN